MNDKYYIGSVVNLKNRLYAYYNKQKLNKENYLIQRAILKYSHDNFSLYILEYCDVNDLIEREQFYLLSENKIRRISVKQSLDAHSIHPK